MRTGRRRAPLSLFQRSLARPLARFLAAFCSPAVGRSGRRAGNRRRRRGANESESGERGYATRRAHRALSFALHEAPSCETAAVVCAAPRRVASRRAARWSDPSLARFSPRTRPPPPSPPPSPLQPAVLSLARSLACRRSSSARRADQRSSVGRRARAHKTIQSRAHARSSPQTPSLAI